MSFNQFSPELLIEVLSHLLDIPTKIRLERVSKRFRDCIKNTESWKYNTKLNISDFAILGASVEELRSFLSRTKVVTTLRTVGASLPFQYLPTLFKYSDKLKISHFSCGVSAFDCRPNHHAVAICLGNFANTLENATIQCCVNADCPIQKTLCELLPLCHNLRKVSLGDIQDQDDEVQGVGNTLLVLDSLMNKSLTDLCLSDFYSTVNGIRLAAVCNTAEDHSISTLTLERHLQGPFLSMRFQLAQFCQSLEPGAARAIRFLKLKYVDCEWIELLPTFPVLFPNLSTLIIKHSPIHHTAEDAINMAQALGAFLHASAEREQPVTLKLAVTAELEQDRVFGGWLWKSIDLHQVCRSGIKRTADMGRWEMTVDQGNVSASIEFKYQFESLLE